MASKSLLVLGLTVVLVLLVGVGAVGYLIGERQSRPAAPDVGSGDMEDAQQALSPVMELYAELREKAVDVPEDSELVEGAIEGMLDTLDDDYARYFPPDAFEAFQASVEGEFVGVGVFLEDTPDGATVRSVIPDTPAEGAGLQPGDRIISVDGEDVVNEPLDAITHRVQGEEGTDVTLGIEREGGETLEVTITRARIDVPVLEARVEDGVGVVELLQFTSTAGEQFEQVVTELAARDEVDGLLLDVRGNGGGVLNDAVEIADVLLDAGPVVRVVESDGRERELDSSDGGITDLPVVVVVDKGSASATEILAGALQERGRAQVVGEQTFGKGTVQTIRRFTNGSGVKFTTAEYFLPSGASIEGEGLAPDEIVEDPDQQLEVARQVLQQQIASQRAPVSP